MINVEEVTQEHVSIGIEWISKMSKPEHWDLTSSEVAALLGVTVESYQDMLYKTKCGSSLSLTSETIERLSLLLGIWKGLQLLVPHRRQNLALSWFNRPNNSSIFAGKTIKAYILENNTLEGFYTVRDYLKV